MGTGTRAPETQESDTERHMGGLPRDPPPPGLRLRACPPPPHPPQVLQALNAWIEQFYALKDTDYLLDTDACEGGAVPEEGPLAAAIRFRSTTRLRGGDGDSLCSSRTAAEAVLEKVGKLGGFYVEMRLLKDPGVWTGAVARMGTEVCNPQ